MPMRSRETNKTVVVPVHSRELKYGMQEAILKQAGIKEEAV